MCVCVCVYVCVEKIGSINKQIAARLSPARPAARFGLFARHHRARHLPRSVWQLHRCVAPPSAPARPPTTRATPEGTSGFEPGPFVSLGFGAINRTAVRRCRRSLGGGGGVVALPHYGASSTTLASYLPDSYVRSVVTWLLADEWHPYRRPSYVTPPFPGARVVGLAAACDR